MITANPLKKIEQNKKRLQAEDTYQDHDFIFASDKAQPLHERNISQRNFKLL